MRIQSRLPPVLTSVAHVLLTRPELCGDLCRQVCGLLCTPPHTGLSCGCRETRVSRGLCKFKPTSTSLQECLSRFCLSHCGDNILPEGFSLGAGPGQDCACLQDLLISRDYHTQHRDHQGRTEYWVNSGLFPSITENRSLFLNFIWPRSGLSGTSESWTSRLRFGCVRLRVPLTE